MSRPDGNEGDTAALAAARLPGRDTGEEALAVRFQGWRELEADLARGLGTSPAVHG